MPPSKGSCKAGSAAVCGCARKSRDVMFSGSPDLENASLKTGHKLAQALQAFTAKGSGLIARGP